MRNPNSGEPFTDSDDEIAAALQDVSIPTLLLSCVHMTDDESVRQSILEGSLKPAGLFLNEVQGYMSEDDKAAARTFALDIIRDYRDRGCPEPRPIDPVRLKQMMTWLVAGDVGDEYVPMMLEEMGLAVREIVRQAMKAFETRDENMAADLADRDQKVNDLNRAIFRRALEVGNDLELREWAMTMTLAARCLERVGDNAVDVGEQIAFVVTGVFREFADASHGPVVKPE
jgi:hypothetical protein